MKRIERVRLHQLRIPLRTPYALSIAVIEAFDTLLVELFDSDGRMGIGEATVLTGYTDETMEQCWTLANQLAAVICGKTFGQALVDLEVHISSAPFTVTALTTAIEMIDNDIPLRSPATRQVLLVALLTRHDKAGLEREIDNLLEQGYRIFKVKVGFDVAQDLERLRLIQKVLSGRGTLRIDANQGYDQAQAIEFVRGLDPQDVELVEQTCAAEDWDAAVQVARTAGIPLMLDESIYDLNDIERAAQLQAAQIIKFKLMKAGGLNKLTAAIQRIRELGMAPLLGNGVAADISCWMEACVADSEHIVTAGEMNGFLKTEHTLLDNPLQVVQGKLTIPGSYWPQLDHAVVDRYREQISEWRS